MSNPALGQTLKAIRRPGGVSSPGYGAPVGFNTPSANVARAMTIDDVIVKTGIAFVVFLLAAVSNLIFFSLPFAMIAMVVALVLGLIIAFKGVVNPVAILSYAALEGYVVGAVSLLFEARAPGIILQATLATGITFAVVLSMFKFAKFRATPKLTRIVIVAALAYLLFSLANLGLNMFGVISTPFGLGSNIEFFGINLGVIIGIVAVLMGSYFLLSDFTNIEEALNYQVDERVAWSFSFGLMVSIVWIYLEYLRLIGNLRN